MNGKWRIINFVIIFIFSSLIFVAHAKEPCEIESHSSLYNYLPGFGDLSAQQISNIKPSFVSSIYAGIVSGLTSGLIVGFVIFLIQKWAETRQLRQTLGREISIFKEEARSHLECTDSFSLHDAETIPDSAKSLNMALKEKPIDLWQEKLPTNKAFIEKLKRFQESIFKFKSTANKLDHKLWLLIRKHNSDRDAISANDPPMYVYCIGKIIGLNDDEIVPFMEVGTKNGKVNSWAVACYNEAVNSEDLSILSNEYIEKKNQLITALNELRKELGIQKA